MKIYEEDKQILSRDFFKFLKYNIINMNTEMIENDEEYYKEFIHKISMLEEALKKNDNTLSSNLLGSLMGMFGYSRHYCSISGQPIIGKYFKINGKPVSKTAYESYKIVQQMERFNKKDEQPKKEVNKSGKK